jgi:hypothetical protein
MHAQRLPRVLFDSNAGSEANGYLLWFSLSREDLSRFNAQEGQHVTLYMPDELECEAVLKWSNDFQCWTGVPVANTWRDLR